MGRGGWSGEVEQGGAGAGGGLTVLALVITEEPQAAPPWHPEVQLDPDSEPRCSRRRGLLLGGEEAVDHGAFVVGVGAGGAGAFGCEVDEGGAAGGAGEGEACEGFVGGPGGLGDAC